MGFVIGSRVKFIKTVLMDDQTSDETDVKFVARAFELEEIDA